MTNRLNKIASTALLAALDLTGLNEARADSIFKGVRGPTNWQLDERVSYSKRETSPNTTQTISQNSILKYWSGDKAGVFGFANIPAKIMQKGELSSAGIGDVSVGLGPRGKVGLGDIGNLHLISYGGVSLPSGNENAKPVLGNGRLDEKVGVFATYLSKNKKFETDTSVEYTFAGEDNLGKKASDELALGIVSGGQVAKNLHLVGGLTGVIKQGGKNDRDYSFGPRVNLRYTFSPRFHVEFVGDAYTFNSNMPAGFGVTALFRYNFGKIH